MRASKTNLLIAAAVALTGVMTAPAGAAPAPYCAWYSDGSTNCGFPTLWSCQASVSGVGGSCGVNPRTRPPRAYDYPSRQQYDPQWIPPPPFRN